MEAPDTIDQNANTYWISLFLFIASIFAESFQFKNIAIILFSVGWILISTKWLQTHND